MALAEKRGWTATDLDGNVYLDCASASASVPVGAGRAELLEPAVEAIGRLGNEDSHALASELTAELGERLLAIAPSSISRYDIALNGTEAVEIAIKIMRRATGRPVIIGFHGSYHGESTMTAALGAEAGADGISVFDDDDEWDVLEEIPNDSAAALLLIEHHWAVPLRDALVRAGGFRISDGFISPLDLVEIGLISAQEAQELHDLETAAAASRP